MAHDRLKYATPTELLRAFRFGRKFTLHYHGKAYNVSAMDARDRVVYVQPPSLPVKVRPDGSSAEGSSSSIWLEEVGIDEDKFAKVLRESWEAAGEGDSQGRRPIMLTREDLDIICDSLEQSRNAYAS